MKKLCRVLWLSLFSFFVAELTLRFVGGWFIAPDHLTHGLPYFVDLKQGIFKTRKFNERPLATHYPYQTKRIPLAEGGVVLARINNLGFRGQDFQKTKAPNNYRVGTLGASSTFGFGVKDSETYPAVLEQYLIEHCPQFEHVEVLNFGAPYQSSETIKNIFSTIAIDYNLDAISFYEGVNDTGSGPPSVSSRLFDFLADRLLILEYIKVPLRNYGNLYRVEDVEWQQEDRGKQFVSHIEAIGSLARKQQIDFYVISQQAQSYRLSAEQLRKITYQEEVDLIQTRLSRTPLTIWEMRLLRHADFMKRLRELAAQQNYQYVDFIPVLDRHSRTHLATWVHLDAQGNRYLAETLGSAIVARHCVPKKSS